MRTSAFIIGVSLVLAAAVFGRFFYDSRVADNTIRVTGAATRPFSADIVKWRISVGRSAGLSGLSSGYSLLRSDHDALVRFLSANAVPETCISVQPVNRTYNYDRDGNVTGYTLSQNFDVVSSDVATITKLALNPDQLYEKGVALQNSNLEYYLSNLPAIKKELIAEATRDARARAEAIAKNSGARLGRIGSARAGVFQITEPFSTEVTDYGIYSTSTRDKHVTITVTATFGLH
uniref:SIMPL domain-containing protein n=1 Tax=candidate division WOR-3 bacterium TaxID=2052148 RepID=A0A7C4GDL3_UNCW3